MTRITRLFLHGFKSFAKPTELVFGTRYNCILGPNGSGKSNIGDAICFVLGKSSSKSLRAEKTANLIYNGGKVKKPAKEAEVSICFDNTEKEFPFETPEVKVTRVVRANGQSIYMINENRCTRTEVVNLMQIAAIDPDGYNIILQGDIIRFVEMSAEERRKVMEEVAGIGAYEDKKTKAMAELDRVEARINEADLILKERENSLKELKKDRDDALKYKDLTEKIKVNKASYLHKQISGKDKELNEVLEQLEEYKKKYGDFDTKITEQKTIIEESRKEIEQINSELQVKGTKEQAELQNKIQKLNVDIATRKQKIENASNEIKKVGERRTQLQKDKREIEQKIGQSEQDQEVTQKQLEKRRAELEDIEDKLKKFKEKHELDKEGDLQKEIDALDKEAEGKQQKIDAIRMKQQEVLREKDKADVQLSVIDERMEKVLELEKENKEQINTLKEKKNEFKKATLELSKILTHDSSLAAQLKTARDRMFVAQEELSKARAQQMEIMEKVGGSDAVRAILHERKNIKGIYGTVAELADVPSKYAMALEVAAGTKLKSVVVEDEHVAQRCIEHLKDKKLGVATFLPLTKLRTRELPANSPVAKKSGVHGFAVELVNFDAKFKKVFSYVFEDVIVVDNLNVAKSIGIGTMKMVTLEGDMVELSGAMRGGYREKSRTSSFTNRELSKRLADLEEQSADNAAVISKLEEQKRKNEEQIAELRNTKAALEGEIITLEKSLHLDGDDLDASKKLKEELQKRSKQLEKEIETINEEILEVNRELAMVKSKKEQLRFKVTKLKSPTTLAELTAFEEKRQELRERIVQLETELKRIIGEHNSIYAQEQEKLKKVIDQLDKDENYFKAQKEELTKSIADLNAELATAEENQKKFFVAFKQYYQRRDKLNSDIVMAEKRLASLYDNVREIDGRHAKITNSKVVLETEKAALQREYTEFEGVELDLSKSEETLKKEIHNWEQSIERMGNINLKALEIYEKIEEEFNKLVEKKDKLRVEKEDVLVLLNEIESKKRELFMKTFDAVHERFQNIFEQLNTKGKVQLVLEKPEAPFEGGLFINVKLTGTKYLDIRSLSGGEKTMTALAFIFAIQEYEPASFYILDEVDAALDKNNSSRFAKLIRKYCDKAQYIVVSHNDAVISEADHLYGISMDEHGISKVTTLKIEEAQQAIQEVSVPGR